MERGDCFAQVIVRSLTVRSIGEPTRFSSSFRHRPTRPSWKYTVRDRPIGSELKAERKVEERNAGTKKRDRRVCSAVFRRGWKKSAEVGGEDVRAPSIVRPSPSSSSHRNGGTTGLDTDDKDGWQRRSTLHFSLDDQGTSTAETGGLRPPVRLPRCTRSLETEEEVWGRQRGRERSRVRRWHRGGEGANEREREGKSKKFGRGHLKGTDGRQGIRGIDGECARVRTKEEEGAIEGGGTRAKKSAKEGD